VIDQDHRFSKKRIAASLWFRSADGALRTIDGYEAMHLIRKRQIRWLPKGDVIGQRQFIHTLLWPRRVIQTTTRPLARPRRYLQHTPSGLEVHLIMDKYGPHNVTTVCGWLTRHTRPHVHFPLTSGSWLNWLNLVERLFGEVTERCVDRGSHTAVRTLEKATLDYLDQRNRNQALRLDSRCGPYSREGRKNLQTNF
jgi:hypothetical protein